MEVKYKPSLSPKGCVLVMHSASHNSAAVSLACSTSCYFFTLSNTLGTCHLWLFQLKLLKTTCSKKPSSSVVLATFQELVATPWTAHWPVLCPQDVLWDSAAAKRPFGGAEAPCRHRSIYHSVSTMLWWCPGGAIPETEKGQEWVMAKRKDRHLPGDSQCASLGQSNSYGNHCQNKLVLCYQRENTYHPGVMVR